MASRCLNGWTCFRGMTLALLILGVSHILTGFISIGISIREIAKAIDDQGWMEKSGPMDGPMDGPKDYIAEDSMGDSSWPHPMIRESRFVYQTILVPNLMGIVCAVMIVITGALGMGAHRTSIAHRKSGLKTGFLVLSILNSISFGPTLIASSVVKHVMYAGIGNGLHVVAILEVLSALVVVVLSIVGSAYACCCTPTEEVKAVPVVNMAALEAPVVSLLDFPPSDKYDLMLKEQFDTASKTSCT